MLSARCLLYQLPDQLSSSCEGSVRKKNIAITEHYVSYSGGKRRLSTLYFVSSGTLVYALDCVDTVITFCYQFLYWSPFSYLSFYSGFARELVFSVSLCPTEQCICTLTKKNYFLLFPMGHACTHSKPTKC